MSLARVAEQAHGVDVKQQVIKQREVVERARPERVAVAPAVHDLPQRAHAFGGGHVRDVVDETLAQLVVEAIVPDELVQERGALHAVRVVEEPPQVFFARRERAVRVA